MNPRNKIGVGVARTNETRAPQAVLQRALNATNMVYQIIDGNGLVDLNQTPEARAALNQLRAGQQGNINAIFGASNYVITSNEPGHALSNHVVIIGKTKFPSPWQVTSRYFRSQMARNYVEQNELNHIHIPKHWVYNVPGSDSLLEDINYVVVTEKVRSNYTAANGAIDESLTAQRLSTISQEIEIGLESSIELRAQLKQLIEGVGLAFINPSHLSFLGEEGNEQVAPLDYEWAGFAEYSVFRHIFNGDLDNIRGGDVRNGLEGLDKHIPVTMATQE